MHRFWEKIRGSWEGCTARGVAFFGALAVLVLYTVPMVLVSHYNQPFHDDFCFAYLAETKGFQGTLSYLYNTALGRYSSNILLTIFGLFAKTSHWFALVRIIPVILLILFFCALLFFVFSLLGGLLGRREKIILGILVFVSSIAAMPSLSEGIYWAASTLTHAFAAVIFLSLLGIILLWYKNPQSRPLQIILAAAAAVLISLGIGMDENTMVLSILTALGLIGLSYKNKPHSRWFAAVIAAATLVSVFFAIHAPGNWQRYSLYQDRLSFVFTIFASTYSTFVEIYKWFNPVMLLAGVLALPLFVTISGKLSAKPKIHPLFVLIGSFGLLDILTAISIFSTGVNPVPRVWDVISWDFIILWFFNIFYAVRYARSVRGAAFSKLAHWSQDRDATLLVWIIFLFVALNGNNIRMVLEDFGRHRAQTYSAELNTRYAVIAKLKKAGEKNIAISSLPVVAGSLYVGDIEPDPTEPGATCYAQYFGVNSITIK